MVSLATQHTTTTTAQARANPLDNPDGTRPGLAAVTSAADRAAARRIISRLVTRGRGPKTGYERTRFGENWADTATGVAYAQNGCRTRDDLLARDGAGIRYRAGSTCEVVAMTLTDPYTGRTIHWTKAHADEI